MECYKIEEACSQGVKIMNNSEDIIQHIFNLLPMRELNKCARVCRLWNTICKRIKQTRRQICCLMNGPISQSDMLADVKQRIQGLPSQPAFALMFCSRILCDSKMAVPSMSVPGKSRLPRAAKMECLHITDYLQRLLPSNCPLVSTTTDGIVGSLSCRPAEFEDVSAFSCLLLPEIPGLTISDFMITYDQERQLDSLMSSTDSYSSHLANALFDIPQGKEPKLIILFVTATISMIYIKNVLLKAYDNVVIAGGNVTDLFSVESFTSTQPVTWNTTGIAFCGDGIKLASVVLREEITTRAEVEETLKKLQDCHIPPVNRIAFMFSTMSRGQQHYKENDLESSVFHKLFPNVPLIGFFGVWSLGYDYLPDYSKPERDSPMSVLAQYQDEISRFIVQIPKTSIFVLVSLGGSS